MNVTRDLDPRFYQTDKQGNIVEFTTDIIIPLEADKEEYILEDKVRLVRAKVVGLRVEELVGTYVKNNLTIPALTIFDSATLTLRSGETTVLLENLPLRQIAKANSNGFDYEVRGGYVNFKESELKVHKNDTIVANTALKIIIKYVKPRKV